jgi:hypothetical protein
MSVLYDLLSFTNEFIWEGGIKAQGVIHNRLCVNYKISKLHYIRTTSNHLSSDTGRILAPHALGMYITVPVISKVDSSLHRPLYSLNL